jgi:hypothetical protein
MLVIRYLGIGSCSRESLFSNSEYRFSLFHFPARTFATLRHGSGQAGEAGLRGIFKPLLLLMSMPVMNIGHVIVFMLLGGMFMLVRVDFIRIIMSVRWVLV